MAESGPRPGRIFISYRREETAYPAGWLFDRLADHFGSGQIFKDVDSIDLGDDFVDKISTAVGSCDVLLALIGDRWLTITDEEGRRRLDDPGDFVRVEIEAALSRNVRVIPILVDGARVPRVDEVPPSLAKLVRRQALDLSPSRFDFDTSRLLKVLDKTLAEVRTAEDGAPAGSEGPVTSDLSEAEPQKAPEPSEQARRTPADSFSPIVVATPDEPSGPSESPDGRRRGSVFARAWVSAAIGVAVLIALIIVGIVVRSPGTVQEDPSGRASQVIFQDDFSDRASGWDDVGANPIGGHYSKGAYRIYAEAGQADEFAWGASPQGIENVFPKAPPNLSLEVDAEKVAGGSHPEDGYGIFCRAEGDGERDYSFILGKDHVTIGKWTADDGFSELDGANIPTVTPNATTHLQAVCTSIEEDAAVHLEFSVNGNVVAAATDRDDPHLVGTLGVFVYTVDTLEVEFDNFVAESTGGQP
jgi:hypothetical protein